MKLNVIRVLLVFLTVGTVLGLLTLKRAAASQVCGVIVVPPGRIEMVCIDEVSVNPPNPSPEDSIEIIVSGTFSNTCPEVLSHGHTISGNDVLIGILIELHPDLVCAQIIEPWSVTEPIGQLPHGDYIVDVTAQLLCNGVLCGGLTTSTSFSVDSGPHFRLSVSVRGSGMVTSSPAGISCRTNPTADPTGCTEDYNSGTPVSLMATPDSGWQFGSWGGDCAGQGKTCSLTMTGPKSATANFAQQTLTVLVPNGGETWPIRSTQTIRWTSSGVSGNVRIELSRDGGASWKTLFKGTPNDGAQDWQVKGPATTQARIRVRSKKTPSISDMSDGNFTIR